MTLMRWLVASALVAGLIGCGGGGGGSPTPTPPTPPPPPPPPASVSIAGTLLVPGNTQTDSDTNDILLTPVRNNTLATAQALPNPVMVGGYLNDPGAGETGPLQTVGDEDDYYSVSLVKDQIIQLTVSNPDPAADDLDLQLYSGNTSVATSDSRTRFEQIVVPATGQYFIRVYVYRGASNYILSIGQPGSSAIVSMQGMDFVPGELLVKMRDTDAGTQKFQVPASSLDLDVVHEGNGMHSLVRLRSTSAAALEKIRPGIGAKLDRVGEPDDIEREKQLTLLVRKELSQRADVEWVEPNWILRATATPNDPLYERQRWHYEQMQLPSAWEITKGSANVIAAVVDTGVRPHEELVQPNPFVDQYDFVDDDTNAADPGVSAQGTYYFHGTHVAGTIAAAGNDGRGVTGVAWNAKIMPVRVLGANGSGTFDDIIQGVRYAARLTNSSGRLPATRADVINLSLGGAGACPAAMQQAVDAARAAGSVIVAAAGNENTSTPSTPAACNGVISVSALDTRRQRAPYSNFGDTVDVAAPGGDTSADRDGDGFPDGVYSTHAARNGTTYAATHTYMQGTSMASPHVAGVIVLMRSVNPAITPAQIDTFLANGSLTDDIGTPGRDSLGVGAINALKAVRAASTNPPAPAPRLDAVPSSLNLGDIGTTNEIVVTNGGIGPIAVTSVTSSAAWLTATQVAVDANGLGRYRVDVNRAGLANGTYQGSVTFNSNPPPPQGVPVTTVNVLIQVASTTVQSDAGQHYLLLIDPATGDAKYQVEVLARGSSVAFSFPSVTPGQYELSVGTDANNDGLICDDGEACGQYPVYGEPRSINATSAVSGLQVTTNYRTDVAPAAATTDNGGRRGQQRLR